PAPHGGPASRDHDLLGLALALALAFALAAAAAGAARRELLRGAPAGGAPGDVQLEAMLGLAGDVDAVRPGGLTEAADAPDLGARLHLRRRVGPQRDLGERPHHHDLSLVDRHRRRPREPAVREPSGEPTSYLVALWCCHDYNITSQIEIETSDRLRTGSGEPAYGPSERLRYGPSSAP